MKRRWQHRFDEEHQYEEHVEFRDFPRKGLTKSRWQTIMGYVRRYNYNGRYPYGMSERGYAYTCGHEWDCCGCLIRTRISIRIQKDSITLIRCSDYNY